MIGDRLRRLVEIGRLDDRRLLRQGPQDLAQSPAKQRMVVGDDECLTHFSALLPQPKAVLTSL